jgi:4-hydroxythreonine-4-phosphate dehydrogenase
MTPIAVSVGDPGGIGPEVALRATLAFRADAARAVGGRDAFVLFGDAAALRAEALALGAEPGRLVMTEAGAPLAVEAGQIALCDAGVAWDAEARRHAPTEAGGRAQLAALDAAVAAVRSGRARALVTGPVSKEAVQKTGVDFIGHTEHLARACGLADDAVTMMFLGPRLRVALATTHVAVHALPREVTRVRVRRAIVHLAEALVHLGDAGAPGMPAPRIVVAGLNPHAGEAGRFGHEEIDTIAPAIDDARRERMFAEGQVGLEGPEGAETALRRAAAGEVAGVVAMTHDQGTIASKLLDWGEAVNVTWGLPFVRTSVDHGVAYAAAGTDAVDARGMQAALALASRLTERRSG